MSNLAKHTPEGVIPQEPSLDSLLANMGVKSGWSAMNAMNVPDQKTQERAQEVADLRHAFVKVFYADPAGKMVLEHLLDKSLRLSTAHPGGTPTLEQCTAYALHRGGQNSFMTYILGMIQDGLNDGKPSKKPAKKSK